MNIPYVKKYNKDGELINPIRIGYFNQFENRKARRETRKRTWDGKVKPPRFKGNGKSIPLSINGRFKFLRHIQIILQKDGSIKRIEHYLPKGNNY